MSVHSGAMQMFGLCQLLTTEIMERLFHGVEGVWRAGEKAEFDQVMELFRHLRAGHARGDGKSSPYP